MKHTVPMIRHTLESVLDIEVSEFQTGDQTGGVPSYY